MFRCRGEVLVPRDPRSSGAKDYFTVPGTVVISTVLSFIAVENVETRRFGNFSVCVQRAASSPDGDF
jgi:hypothetical protein